MDAAAKPLVPQLLEMITGGWTAGAIAAAAEVGVADALASGPRDAASLARELGLNEDALYRLMRYLASAGFFVESAQRRFELTELGSLLREDVPNSMRAAAIFLPSHHAQRPWERAVHSLKTGKPSFDAMYGMNAWEWYAKNPGDAAVFNNAMSALSGSLHKAAVEVYDFSGIGTIMDIGGGHGHLLSLILKKSPSIRGVLFDQPHVVREAAPVFASYGVADRAQAVGGSFLEKVPPGADAHIMAHILHDWDDEHCKTILRNCRAAINQGGKLLVIDAVLLGPNEPDFGKLLDLEMLLVPGGRERTADEFHALFAACGWRFSRVIPTPAGKSIIEASAA